MIGIAAYFYDMPGKVETFQAPVAMVNGEPPKHGFLGVRFVSNTSTPLVVQTVFAGSGAAEAGLRAGDAIESIGTANLPDYAAVERMVEPTSPGDIVPMTISRGGTELKLRVRLISFTDMIVSMQQSKPVTLP